MKHLGSKIKSKGFDGHFQDSLRLETISIELDTDARVSQTPSQINYYFYICFVFFF